MKISTAFPSKYLRAADLEDRSVHVVMSHVDMETLGDTDKKPVLYFAKHTKGIVLNKINSKTISTAYGDDTENWRGKPLIIFTAMVEFRGDMVEAIRVRIPKMPVPSGLPKSNSADHSEINPPPIAAATEAVYADADDEIPF